MKRFNHFFRENPVWAKVLLFSLTLFFLQIADGIIAFWAPNQIQNILGNSVYMGLIISFQSVVGFFADLIFPVLLKTVRVRRLIVWGILTAVATSFFLFVSTYQPLVLIFLITMILWGVYYEFLSFANYQFMGSVVPLHMRSSAWSVAGIFSNLAFFLGPLIATIFILKSYISIEIIFLTFILIAFLILMFSQNTQDVPIQIDLKKINPWMEFKHWMTLARVIWPLVIISVLIGFIDSTYWTVGAVWTEKLAAINSLGGLFLSLYQFPPIFLGLIVAKWGIYKGKKFAAEKFLIFAGLFLFGLFLNDSIIWQLAMVLISSIALAICNPLLEGVYTDIVARMGKEKKDMIGLRSSTINLSYIIWPPIAGIISENVGERFTFSYLGLAVALVSFILLFVTPKKLRLPQEEIKKWG